MCKMDVKMIVYVCFLFYYFALFLCYPAVSVLSKYRLFLFVMVFESVCECGYCESKKLNFWLCSSLSSVVAEHFLNGSVLDVTFNIFLLCVPVSFKY